MYIKYKCIKYYTKLKATYQSYMHQSKALFWYIFSNLLVLVQLSECFIFFTFYVQIDFGNSEIELL